MGQGMFSLILSIAGISLFFKGGASALYHLDVEIVNNYGKDIRIITTHPNKTYKNFAIPAGDSYRIKSTHSSAVEIHITAFDVVLPITINGKNSVSVAASLTSVSVVYYVPTAPNTPTPTPFVSTDAAGTSQVETKKQRPTNISLSTKGPTKSVSTQGATHHESTSTKPGPTPNDSVSSHDSASLKYSVTPTQIETDSAPNNADEEDVCEKEKIYIAFIVIFVILLVILFLIIIYLVRRQSKTNGTTETDNAKRKETNDEKASTPLVKTEQNEDANVNDTGL